MNQLTWLLLLPLVCALVNVLPRVRDAQSGERRWFPLGIYMLWLVGTGVHLYCLDYVYEFKLSRALFAPALVETSRAVGARVDVLPAANRFCLGADAR